MEMDPAYFRQVAARAEELEQAMSVPGAAASSSRDDGDAAGPDRPRRGETDG